jgi:hypothetical protein
MLRGTVPIPQPRRETDCHNSFLIAPSGSIPLKGSRSGPHGRKSILLDILKRSWPAFGWSFFSDLEHKRGDCRRLADVVEFLPLKTANMDARALALHAVSVGTPAMDAGVPTDEGGSFLGPAPRPNLGMSRSYYPAAPSAIIC